jgi:NAD(P)-dependent dehydrogenase (short-subunit alcohol dehydrogenase family)
LRRLTCSTGKARRSSSPAAIKQRSTPQRDIGGGVQAFHSDISNVADLESLRAYVETTHGRVDIIFATAGGGRPGMLEQVSENAEKNSPRPRDSARARQGD